MARRSSPLLSRAKRSRAPASDSRTRRPDRHFQLWLSSLTHLWISGAPGLRHADLYKADVLYLLCFSPLLKVSPPFETTWFLILFLILIFLIFPPVRQWLNDQLPALRWNRARGSLRPPRTPVTGVGCAGPRGHQKRRVGTFGLSCSGLSHGQWTSHPERVWHGECISHYPKKTQSFSAIFF